ncbi:TniQ family protein [Luteibacter sp. RCC_6_2]|uniref:TniQ family protein n=1 Tax=Luteibacter sp. RCC_6_2 TaxID=3239223 RepID=UPI00352384D0
MSIDRWPIPGLGEDESLQSLVSRAECFFDCRPGYLWKTLREGEGDIGTPDAPTPQAVIRLAGRLDCSPSEVARHRLTEARDVLVAAGRVAYCPTCWKEDLDAKRPVAFRRQWAHVCAVLCSRHATPLIYWRMRQGAKGRKVTTGEVDIACEALASMTTQPGFNATMKHLAAFAEQLHACLYSEARTAASWRRNPKTLLRDIAAALTDQELRTGLWSTAIPLRWQGFVHVGRAPMSVAVDGPWQTLRQATDPGMRRAALWYGLSLARPDIVLGPEAA